MNKLALITLFAALATASTSAHAGFKWSYPVVIHSFPGYSMAYGAIGSARGSADTVQQIGCSLIANSSYSYVECTARDASGKTLSCYNRVNEGMKQAVASITATARISFQTDPTD